MAGIYIHIPFCKKSCYYCDFHFSTSLKNKSELINALIKEIWLRKNELKSKKVKSIYFGGGTPSLISTREFEKILESINKYFEIDPKAEITVEANPDDLSLQKLKELGKAGVNRLSIGIQSFKENDLKWMNRSHTATQAMDCVINSQNQGFKNISIDLIYGIPSLSLEDWGQNLETAFSLGINHMSCYCLTAEPNTPMSYFIKKGKYPSLNERLSIEHFKLLLERMDNNKWLQYEISNFCKNHDFSKHNTSYWKGEIYLGIGPSAHSYNGSKRRWNIANNNAYINRISNGLKFYNEEIISLDVSYNEYILTALRTVWGCNLRFIEKKYGTERKNYFSRIVKKHIKKEWVNKNNEFFTLSNEGKLFADSIACDLMVEI